MATKKTEHETLGIDPGDALELGTPEPNQLATATEYHSFEGETDASDIQIPYLKLWQASCDEAKLEEPIGSLVRSFSTVWSLPSAIILLNVSY